MMVTKVKEEYTVIVSKGGLVFMKKVRMPYRDFLKQVFGVCTYAFVDNLNVAYRIKESAYKQTYFDTKTKQLILKPSLHITPLDETPEEILMYAHLKGIDEPERQWTF